MSEQNAGPDNANAAMRRYWNEVAGPRWVERAEVQEARNIDVAELVLREAQARPGEEVLDVGCGPGATAIPLAAAVGPSGHVTGVDISEPMLGLLRQRIAERGIGNLIPLLADAQTHAFPPASFDLVTSRFGVMFFADPRVAFANLAGALAPGGRLGFHCWKTLGENPWMTVPLFAALQHVPAPKPSPPDAPGPFAFADAARVRGILADAGLAEIAFESRNDPVSLGGGSLDAAVDFTLQMGPASIALREASPETIAKVRASVREALAPYQTPAGVELATSSWVVTARRL
jgi:SAM-dependent methyltransferase